MLTKKRKWIIAIAIIIVLFSSIMFYHTHKSLPPGISYKGSIYKVDKVDFLSDLTYLDANKKEQHEKEIFASINKAIQEAQKFIVLDMFLFNGYTDGKPDYPEISSRLVDSLLAKNKANPNIEMLIISDEINTTYQSHKADQLGRLEDAGIEVIYTNLKELRDPTPLYSAVWRAGIQWFGQAGHGWLANPMAKDAPKVTLRSYLELLNVKANHRKLIATEQTAIISSANPHDASGFHSNIAFQVWDERFIKDVLEAEGAVANYSAGKNAPEFQPSSKAETGNITVQLTTEGETYKNILREIKRTEKGDQIWLGMFYLADREVIAELVAAAVRGVNIQLILDPNQNAFGQEKIGLPNLPVAAELEALDNANITIRWYDTGEEQYHSKLMYIKTKNEGTIIGGSANFTKRNLDNFTLEADVTIKAKHSEKVIQDVNAYFERIWNNENGHFTADYKKYQKKLPVFKYLMYRVQKFFRLTTY